MLKRIRDLVLSVGIFGSSVYAYLYYESKKNQRKYLEIINSDTLRDASRLSNQSFGISWGFQADDTIMSRIDSGDLLFLRFDCSECLRADEMVGCYWTTSHLLQEEYHSLGYAFRDQTGLYVIYNSFGVTQVKSYCELVSLPYIKTMTLQKKSKNEMATHLKIRKQTDFDKPICESISQFLERTAKIMKTQGRRLRVQDFLSGEQTINIRTQTNNTLRSL